MSTKYKIRDQHGLNYLTCTICGWVDLFTRAEYRDIVLDSWRYCSQQVFTKCALSWRESRYQTRLA